MLVHSSAQCNAGCAYQHSYISTAFALLLFRASQQWLDGMIILQTSWHQLKSTVATRLVLLDQKKHAPSSLNLLKIFWQISWEWRALPCWVSHGSVALAQSHLGGLCEWWKQAGEGCFMEADGILVVTLRQLM